MIRRWPAAWLLFLITTASPAATPGCQFDKLPAGANGWAPGSTRATGWPSRTIASPCSRPKPSCPPGGDPANERASGRDGQLCARWTTIRSSIRSTASRATSAFCSTAVSPSMALSSCAMPPRRRARYRNRLAADKPRLLLEATARCSTCSGPSASARANWLPTNR